MTLELGAPMRASYEGRRRNAQSTEKDLDMEYKTILVHADKSRHAAERFQIAAQIALLSNAHLIGAAMTGLSAYTHRVSVVGAEASGLAFELDLLQKRAESALQEFEQRVQGIGVHSIEARLINDEAGDGMSKQARYCDLLVIGQTDPDEMSPAVLPDFPEYVVLHSGRPVLIVPYMGHFKSVGSKVLIAWDGSLEATRAVTSAIPLLQRASLVTVAVFNAASHRQTRGEQVGADIALYLARHNVRVEVAPQTTDIDVGNALLSLAADSDADLIVMGGYGHSRLREILLGGVTRTVLKTMTVPVWMCH